jgi:hypothetical protein
MPMPMPMPVSSIPTSNPNPRPTGPLRRLAAAAAVALAAAVPAQAALVDRGGGLVYDTVRDITWLAAPALLPGVSNWFDAVLFAGAFVHAGATDWRLPASNFVDAGCAGAEGFGCSDSEMAHLFYAQLGGQAGQSVFDATGDDAGEIAAVAALPALAATWFWSWQVADDGSNTAFAFNFGTGEQAIRNTDRAGLMLLIHAGDVGGDLTTPTPVPEPPTLALAICAAALAFGRRRRLSATA